MNIPLFDTLREEARQLKEDPDPKKFSSVMNSMSSDVMEGVMALIYHYAITVGDYSTGKMPYAGKIFNGTNGVKYTVADLPSELQKILWLFIDGNSIIG